MKIFRLGKRFVAHMSKIDHKNKLHDEIQKNGYGNHYLTNPDIPNIRWKDNLNMKYPE